MGQFDFRGDPLERVQSTVGFADDVLPHKEPYAEISALLPLYADLAVRDSLIECMHVLLHICLVSCMQDTHTEREYVRTSHFSMWETYLPADTGGKVINGKPVFGARGRTIPAGCGKEREKKETQCLPMGVTEGSGVLSALLTTSFPH